MRIRHILWKVKNGWLLVPESCTDSASPSDAAEMYVFKDLKEFSGWKPVVKRNRKPKPTAQGQAPITGAN